MAARVTTRRLRLVTALGLVGLAACTDLPSEPRALELLAGGRTWVAIQAPPELPTASTWVPFLAHGGPQARAVAVQVKQLEREAARAREADQFERAGVLRQEASRLAAASLEASPGPQAVNTALWALDHWLGNLHDAGLDELPVLAPAVDSVRTSRATAVAALQAGDTLRGVRALVEGAESIRSAGPEELARRALRRAESGLPRGDALPRARRLVRGARQALRTRDALLAFQRAIYALQLEAGAGTPTAEPPGDCAGEGCDRL
jgi:hypothetical protein